MSEETKIENPDAIEPEAAVVPEMPEAAVAPDMPEPAAIDVVEIKKFKEGAPAGGQDRKKFFYTKKVCKYCTRQIEEKAIDYKNIDLLKRYVMPSGKILPRRISGNCAKHQRKIVTEIKKARIIALLPFLDR